jgi:hypothetical protein
MATTPLLPVDTVPPSSVGGVANPNPAAPSNFVSQASANTNPAPPFADGLNTGSIIQQASTPISQASAANGENANINSSVVFPANGYIPKPADTSTVKTFLADWYRNGNSGTEFASFDARTLEDFDNTSAGGYSGIAQLYVFKKDGKEDKPLVPPFSKFILESVTETHAERSQIVETFGDFYVFVYGERPPMYNFTGTLINAKNANWLADFKYYYENYLRGTKCVEQGARLVITYGGRQIEGFMLSMQTMTDASIEKGVKLSFPVVVTKKSFIRYSYDLPYVTTNGVTGFNASLAGQLQAIAGPEGKDTSTPEVSTANTAATTAMSGGPAAGPTPAPGGQILSSPGAGVGPNAAFG